VDVFDEVTVTAQEPIPAEGGLVPFDAYLVSLWTGTDPCVAESAHTRVRVLKPDGSQVGSGEAVIGLTKHEQTRTTIRLETLPFFGSGTYWFTVEYRASEDQAWEQVAALPVDITLATSTEHTAEATPRAMGEVRSPGGASAGSEATTTRHDWLEHWIKEPGGWGLAVELSRLEREGWEIFSVGFVHWSANPGQYCIIARRPKQNSNPDTETDTFLECEECRRKPGMPVLCRSCLHNRAVIGRLWQRCQS